MESSTKTNVFTCPDGLQYRKHYVFALEPQPAQRFTKKQMRLTLVMDARLTKEQLQIKNRILRHIRFKAALAILALQQRFKLPDSRFHVVFHIGTDKKERWLKPHQHTPDADNLVKLFKDALKAQDKNIYNYMVSKYWSAQGHIEVFCERI